MFMLRVRAPAPRAMRPHQGDAGALAGISDDAVCELPAWHGGWFILTASTHELNEEPAGISSANSAMLTHTSSSDIKLATLLLAFRARCAKSGRCGHVTSACHGTIVQSHPW